MARGPGKDQFADTLVRMMVLSEEARKRKLDQTEKFKEQMRFSEANLLASTLAEQLRNEVDVSEPVLRKYYEQHRCEYQTWKPRHVLVRTKGSPLPLKPGATDLTDEEALARAQAIRQKLKDGADFAEVARAESDDLNSVNQGGDIGQVRHGQVVPSLEETFCSLNPGELSQPVKTPFGYHVIRMESKEAPALEEMKAQLEQKYRPEAAKKAIDEMIAQRKVVKDPAYYAPVETNDVGTIKK
jgi:peptidyl-prolyl cis-trans isomerase C